MRLPVLNNTPNERDRLQSDLESLVDGEVRFDRHNRMLYATDASLYQVEPIGVVIAANTRDVERVTEYCGKNGVALLARGGGTSLAGQCTNRAVVVDVSAGCRGIGEIESNAAGEATVWVEPGVTVDELNRELTRRVARLSEPPEAQAGKALHPHLFFAPDPATTAQATIGGCIGNNAAGARSIRYGRTSENLAAVEVILSTGEKATLEAGAGQRNPVARRLAERVIRVVNRHAGLIRERFPRTIRRNAGYGLDLVLDQVERGATAETVDLSGLLCGSEGTLAVTLGARLKLREVPRSKGLAVLTFATLEDAIEAVSPILDSGRDRGLSAVELLDDVVLGAAMGNLEYRRYVQMLPGGEAAPRGGLRAVLFVEFFGFGEDSAEQVQAGFAALRELFKTLPGAHAIATHTDSAAMLSAWKLRRAGEPLLHGLPGRRKPVTFVEDNAVPVERLGEFVREFKKIVARHGTRAAYWAHASVGVLHVRPMIDLHDPEDRARMREIAVEAADLARTCGGIMSGEHGDGRVRGPLLERFFGPDLMRAFGEVKRLFDPAGVLNPGDIVGAGPVESMTENLRVMPAAPEGGRDARPTSPTLHPTIQTYFDYEDQHGFLGAAEMCNGAGVCRKRTGGTMCPSYMGTMDERHSTRGRGNALRLAITGQIGRDAQACLLDGPAWNDPATLETLSLCLSCKACKSECPSNVDIARLKSEYLAQSHKERGGAPLRARVIGNVRVVNRLGSLAPGLANWVNSLGLTKRIMRRYLGISERRVLPRFAKREGIKGSRHRGIQPERGNVVLFADCFTTYNEPRIARAAVMVLEKLGYGVEVLPREGDGGFGGGCCARSLISVGMLGEAVAMAEKTIDSLRNSIENDEIKAILVCEPSCLSAFKDDWLQLKMATPKTLRQRLAAKSMLVEEFVGNALGDDAPQTNKGPVLLHGHCHQKALWGAETSAGALRKVAGDHVIVLDTGCCGMAGSFGYEADKYDLSMKIGELSLFPAVRAARPGAIIAAPGTSCRHQIRDGTGREALHPIEIIAMAVSKENAGNAGDGDGPA